MKIGLMAGTGMDYLSPEQHWSEVSTPFGIASIAIVPMGGQEIVLVQRHGTQLNVPPHLINHRANIWAMHDAGVHKVLATAAVGSLRKTIEPGDLAVIEDFIDFTRRRDSTIHDRPGECVVHTDVSAAYCPIMMSAIEESAACAGITIACRVVYLCVDGPRYETPSEIRMFAQWGADVIGMTGVPEVVLARELGMRYASLAVVTNYAAGIRDDAVYHNRVVEMVETRRSDLYTILEGAISRLAVDDIPD